MARARQTTIPIEITAGSTLALDLSISDLPASDGGEIAIYLKGPAVIKDSDFTYGVDGDLFTVDVAATLTTNWPPGIYQFTLRHTDTDDVVDNVASGRIEILPDPTKLTEIDARTFAETNLPRIEALINEISLNPYKTIQWADTIYSGQNITELKKIRDEIRNERDREKLAEISKKGSSADYDVAFEMNDNV